MNKSTVLFSGGLDSTTALYWALNYYQKVHALTFDYGQRHRLEISAARRIAAKLDVPHEILRVDLSQIGGSSLTDSSIPLPHASLVEKKKKRHGPPSTYVPFRNGIFLALAAAWAEVNEIRDIICGFNVIDSPDYPDTSREFTEAMEKAINTGTKAIFTGERITIITPFVKLKKSEIIKQGLALGADYSYAISCYSGREIPCLECTSCLLRKKAWDEIGIKDHLLERLRREGKI